MPDFLGSGFDYFVVGMLGTAVGIGELVARYRDEPVKALRSWSALVYVAVNALASLAALGIIHTFGWFGTSPPTDQSNLTQVLIAGFGAMAVFRSSLFVVRVGKDDVGVGPIAFLQVILGASDRGVDRKRGVDRAPRVAEIMDGLAFDDVAAALPPYAMALLQNVDPDDAQELGDRIAKLRDAKMTDRLKVLNLGLVTMNVVGEDVLEAAANAFRKQTAAGGRPADLAPLPATPGAAISTTPAETPTEPTIGRSAPGTAVGGSTDAGSGT